MNVYDSGRISDCLASLGYFQVERPESADLVILNTCAIRKKAEQKVFSFLGRMAELKLKNPDMIIGVGGCVAQQEGKKILDRSPYLDLVFGTHAIGRLPHLLKRIETSGARLVDVDLLDCIQDEGFHSETKADEGKISKFVTIMQGCDNFCSYCVVPYVRGREMSRSSASIVSEIEELVASGLKEVTLLGQNVNSYGKKEGLCDFPELLSMVNGIDNLLRIRFTTSHPKDISDGLIQSFKELDKLCKHVHLPVQSGSSRILSMMNRRYTREMYLEKICSLRDACPEIAITSDIIVGFPGETHDDLEDTLSLIREVEFDGLFAFMYSDRPNAPASGFAEKISESEKARRLQEVLSLQKTITLKKNKAMINTSQVVLVEGKSRKLQSTQPDFHGETAQWYGRATSSKIVHFPETENFSLENTTGRLINVFIQKAFPNSLWGLPSRLEE